MSVAGIVGCFGDDAGTRVDQIASRLQRGARQAAQTLTSTGFALASLGAGPVRTTAGAIVIDGELYNYALIRKELISEGYTFSAPQSAEVVPYLYAEFGPDACRLLDGEFALIMADANGRPCLARDRYGSRTIFYGRTVDGALAAASEPDALATIVEQVRELPPGAYYHPSVGELEFFAMPRGTAYIYDPAAGAALTRYHVREAVERRLPPAGPVAVILDPAEPAASAIIAALAKEAGREVELYAPLTSDDSATAAWVRQVADHLQLSAHKVVVPNDRTASIERIAQAIADHGSDVVLSSLGSDELYGSLDSVPAASDDATHASLQAAARARPGGAFRQADRAAAASGIELRAVFADPNVVMAAWETSPRLKYRNGRGGWLLGHIASRYLPDDLVAPGLRPASAAAGR